MSEGFTLWFTGLSGAGKSTLANLVADELRASAVIESRSSMATKSAPTFPRGWVFPRKTAIPTSGESDMSATSRTERRYRDLGRDLPVSRVRDEVRGMHRQFLRSLRQMPDPTLAERDVKGLYKKHWLAKSRTLPASPIPTKTPLKAELIAQSRSETKEQEPKRACSPRSKQRNSSSGRRCAMSTA